MSRRRAEQLAGPPVVQWIRSCPGCHRLADLGDALFRRIIAGGGGLGLACNHCGHIFPPAEALRFDVIFAPRVNWRPEELGVLDLATWEVRCPGCHRADHLDAYDSIGLGDGELECNRCGHRFTLADRASVPGRGRRRRVKGAQR